MYTCTVCVLCVYYQTVEPVYKKTQAEDDFLELKGAILIKTSNMLIDDKYKKLTYCGSGIT